MRNRLIKYIGKKGGHDNNKSRKHSLEIVSKLCYTCCDINGINEDYQKGIVTSDILVDYFIDKLNEVVQKSLTDVYFVKKIAQYCLETLHVNICSKFLAVHDINSLTINNQAHYINICKIIELSKKKIPNEWYFDKIISLNIGITDFIHNISDLRTNNRITCKNLKLVPEIGLKKIKKIEKHYIYVTINTFVDFCDKNNISYEAKSYWSVLFTNLGCDVQNLDLRNLKLRIDNDCIEYVCYQAVAYKCIDITKLCVYKLYKLLYHKKVSSIDINNLVVLLCGIDIDDDIIRDIVSLNKTIKYNKYTVIDINIIKKITQNNIINAEYNKIYTVLCYVLDNQYSNDEKYKYVVDVILHCIMYGNSDFLDNIFDIVSKSTNCTIFDITHIINTSDTVLHCGDETISLFDTLFKYRDKYKCIKFNLNELNNRGLMKIAQYSSYDDIMYWYDNIGTLLSLQDLYDIIMLCIIASTRTLNVDTFDALITLFDECDMRVHFVNIYTIDISLMINIVDLLGKLKIPYQCNKYDDRLCPMCLNIPTGVTCAPCCYGHIYCIECLIMLYQDIQCYKYDTVKCIICQ